MSDLQSRDAGAGADDGREPTAQHGPAEKYRSQPGGDSVGDAKYCRAELVRGRRYVLLCGDDSIVFEPGKKIAVSEAEYERLAQATDPATVFDGARRYHRRVRKFAFFDSEGNPIKLEPLPDEPIGVA